MTYVIIMVKYIENWLCSIFDYLDSPFPVDSLYDLVVVSWRIVIRAVLYTILTISYIVVMLPATYALRCMGFVIPDRNALIYSWALSNNYATLRLANGYTLISTKRIMLMYKLAK